MLEKDQHQVLVITMELTPPSGGYTIYLNKATGGPSIYTVTTEAQLIQL
jgi:hypothetical protein